MSFIYLSYLHINNQRHALDYETSAANVHYVRPLNVGFRSWPLHRVFVWNLPRKTVNNSIVKLCIKINCNSYYISVILFLKKSMHDITIIIL